MIEVGKGWVGDGSDQTVGYQDAQNFLDLRRRVCTSIVEECVAVIVSVGAEVVSVFL